MLNLIEDEMPILVLVNKQDLVDQQPLKPEEVVEVYEINTLGEGVDIAMQWMIEKLTEILV